MNPRKILLLSTIALAGLNACGGAATPPPAQPGSGGTRTCTAPGAGEDFTSVNPADTGVDAAILKQTIDWVATQNTSSFRVFRHGCLIGQTVNDVSATSYLDPSEYYSMTKSITSMMVGRAISLGYLNLDDPVSKFFPQADSAHGSITVRQLLDDTSGLAFNWIVDVLGSQGDSVSQVLGLPIAAPPGTKWAYSQTTFSLLAQIVSVATGMDYQTFAQQEFFGPLGISRSEWNWQRDASGYTHGYSWFQSSPLVAARVGQLLLNAGEWRGTRLISAEYIAALRTGTAAQPAYGLGVRLNQGNWYNDSATGQYVPHKWNPQAPDDLVEFSGLWAEKVSMVPSLDLMVVRFGFQPFEGAWEQKLYSMLLPGVTP